MECKACEENPGYIWDTLYPCPDCDTGRKVQHDRDKAELVIVVKRARILRKRIKDYEQR